MIYLVLGAGENSMGEAIAYRLLQENGSQVFIADKIKANIEHALAKLDKLPRAKNASLEDFSPKGEGLDVVSHSELLPFYFRNCDVVISALPAALNPGIAEGVALSNQTRPTKVRTHFCDLGGVLDITKKMIHWDADQTAKEYGFSIVPDCGLQPGLGNVIAVDLMKNFDPAVPVESMIIYVGGLPLDFEHPPYYKRLFNLKGLAEIYFNSPLVLHKGKPLKISKLSHYETISTRDFDMYFGTPEIIKFEAAVTGGLGALPYYLQDHVTTLQEKTLRYHGHYNRVKVIPPKNFEKIFTDWLESFPVPEKDFTVMKVVATGKSIATGKRVKIEKFLNVCNDANWNSMQKTTGFSTAVMAKLIAEGKARNGAAPPEIALDPSTVLEALKKDFCIYERLTPLK